MQRNRVSEPKVLQKNPEIEFWFEFGSNYSYLSVMRIESAAALTGCKIIWRPFLLGPIFKSFGWDTSPFLIQKEKGAYMWRDMQRECAKYDLPWTQPSDFPRAAILPARVAAYGADKPWIGEFCRHVITQNFVHDRAINDNDAVAEALENAGQSAAQVIENALAPDNKGRLREWTEQAQRRGVFGAPTFFVGDEMFWGNDRLDDALAFANAKSEK